MPTSSNSNRGYRRGKRISDLMTREYYAFVDSSVAAERAGDAALALEYHQGVPMFSRSAHRVVLAQLAGLADEMTPWLWARWAAYQCTRAEDDGTVAGEVQRFALDYTLRMFHTDELAVTYDEGGDPIPFVARTAGEDWAFHQICTYEMDGLALFVDTMATDRLAEECALAREWVESVMGSYRIESSEPGELVVRDLETDESLALLNLGARVHADPGGLVIGRLVPSGPPPGLMFDTRPLPVDEQTAREVAEGDAPTAWITALEHALADGRVDRSVLQTEDRVLVTDVPDLTLIEVGTPPAALASTMEQLRDGRDEVGRAAYRILRAAADGSFDAAEPAACVAAAVLNPHAHAEAVGRLVHPDHQDAWGQWAQMVPDPARGRLRHLADLSSKAAA